MKLHVHWASILCLPVPILTIRPSVPPDAFDILWALDAHAGPEIVPEPNVEDGPK